MTASFSVMKFAARAFLLVGFVLLAGMLLPRAAHAQSLPYPIDPNMWDNFYCSNGSSDGPPMPTCTTSELNGTQIVDEFTITDVAGNTAEAYTTNSGKVQYVNSSITVYPGEPLTYAWSLDPEMIVRTKVCTDFVLGLCVGYGNQSNPQYYFDNDPSKPINSTFGQNSQYGQVVVTAPSSGSASSTIGGAFGITTQTSNTVTTSQTCTQSGQSTQCSCPSGYHATTQGSGQGGSQTICSKTTVTTHYPPIYNLDLMVKVGGSAPATPTLSITTDQGSSASITTVGSTVINATFSAASGDTLSQTSLNVVPPSGPEYTIPGYGYSPVSSYSYTFATTTLGTFIFKPYVETGAYPAWATEGKSVTVTVTTPLCANALNGGATGTYPSCTCINGGTYYSSNNSCSSANSCLFNGFSVPSGNTVTAYQAPSVTSPATCQSQTRTCTNGVLSGSYAYGSCTVTIPSGSISSALTATPSRVHPGNSTTLTWSTSNMASCKVTSSDTPVQTLSTALSSTGLTTPAITRAEIYTLFCLDANSTPYVSQVQVKLVPVVQEL